MDDAHTDEKALQAAKKRQEWLINYLKNADDRGIDGLIHFCERHKLLMFREPAEETQGEAD